MIKNLKIDLELMEMMHYYWKASSEKEKVGEPYIYAVVDHPHMAVLYSENFTKEMARQVMSAISNREIFKPETKEAGRFWNNNMWMMEDLGVTDAMFAPIKQLNLDAIIGNPELGGAETALEIIFVPGHLDVLYRAPGKLYINFFKLMTSFVDDTVSIEGQPLQAYIESVLK